MFLNDSADFTDTNDFLFILFNFPQFISHQTHCLNFATLRHVLIGVDVDNDLLELGKPVISS